MINLDNDVLNKERRKLFPKIDTLSNKFSLNTMNFLKKQNPFKFYRSFYLKHIKNYEKKQARLKSSKSVSFLKMLSKTQNYFFSVPIQYNSSNENNEIKSHMDLELNKFLYKSKMNIRQNESAQNISEINYIDFLKNKALINLYKSLRKTKKSRNIKTNEKKENKQSLYNNTNKSCINLYKENINNKIKDTVKNNNNYNYKKLQKLHIKNNKFMYNNKLKHDDFNFNKQKYEETKEEKKFNIKFIKNKNNSLNEDNKNQKNKNKLLASSDNIYKANIYWSNLRRPIVIYNSNFS